MHSKRSRNGDGNDVRLPLEIIKINCFVVLLWSSKYVEATKPSSNNLAAVASWTLSWKQKQRCCITNHMYLSVVNFSVRVSKSEIYSKFVTRNLDMFDFEPFNWLEIFLTGTINFRKGLVALPLNSVPALQLVNVMIVNMRLQN